MTGWQDVERLKAQGRYRTAGQLAALIGRDNNMGCHFGMRSTAETAREEFRQGHAEVMEVFEAETAR